MRFLLPILLIISLSSIHSYAQEGTGSAISSTKRDKRGWDLKLDSIMVTGHRKTLTEVGVTKSHISEELLRVSLTNSLADVLAQGSSVFIKSHGRGSLSTASFRGTAPSHTQVTWNGIKLNSPMLGMVDFSLIPSYFIDNANLYHGASSIAITGGGLGGAIALETTKSGDEGLMVKFIQGFGSYSTFDEFLHLTYSNERFESSTRLAYTTSKNDFKYRNYNKKDDTGEYPIEQNKSGAYKDLHILQELYYQIDNKNRVKLSAWFLNSDRGIPMLSVNYREEGDSQNKQYENNLRVVAGWERFSSNLKLSANAGYTYSDMLYSYMGDIGQVELKEMIRSSSIIHTGYGKFSAKYYLGDKFFINGELALYQHSVMSSDKYTSTGYNMSRSEISAILSAKYRPVEWFGFGADIREELYGDKFTSPIPAAFIDFSIWKRYNITARASIARNFHFPTLNDLYFQPGGNPDLRTENGYTYDAGVTFGITKSWLTLNAEATFYKSDINDWIIWLPSFKGFWTPKNVKKVKGTGVELKGSTKMTFNEVTLTADANWAWTRSINHGDPANWADESIGKQLVYIPEYSASVMGRIAWRNYGFTYKFNYYSERFTTSNNDASSKIGIIGAYYMNDIALDYSLKLRWADISIKLNINNLFNEEYVSILSRPMAGINYNLFLEITPHIGKKNKTL